ncbi:hypothetical protein LAZ67_21002260 [Cordylochernes scorpioides]|uniref:HTH CENPB-type domain-containing protein n=1 Tax=Cordylochernes scorpioides TaxID=51811 RepID=A0ABY6LQP3_9ARAC|nr:hypothetical protein LAZ67_21002260 [Cordylochernes scorpioides]
MSHSVLKLDIVRRRSDISPTCAIAMSRNSFRTDLCSGVSKSNVFIWHKRFSDGRNTLENDKHTGRPSSSKTLECIEKVREFVAGITGEYYLNVLKRLIARIHRIRPEYRDEDSWCLLHDNAPSHSSLIVRRFLTKNNRSVRSGTNLSSKISSYSRGTLIEKTEKALVIWIEDLTQKRIPLDGHLIKMKALKFYKELKESEPSTSSRESNPQFSASTGWLTGFIKRHSFHNLKIKGEVASADEEAARKYPEKFAKIIKDGGYCAHQIFNADETGLFWKKMPTRTYIAKSEKNASGFKAAKDRVTLLLCSNASGDRMLKPLLVNRSLKPRALKGKDLNTLPVHWMANKKAWVTTAIFTEWFNKCFVPEVENYMKVMGLEFKILLILDNAPDHVALAIAEIKSQTLNACWKAAWPECVSKRNESNRTTIVTSDIISIAKEIGGEGFDDFGEHDIEELLVDEALNDDDILESKVDTTKDFETVDSELEDVTPLDEKLLREGLQLSGKLEKNFIQNDNDVERALKFQRDLKFCMSGYRELYKELVKPSQRLITDYLVKEKKITEVPKEALPCRSDDVILSSSDESDLAPIHKRVRTLSDSE